MLEKRSGKENEHLPPTSDNLWGRINRILVLDTSLCEKSLSLFCSPLSADQDEDIDALQHICLLTVLLRQIATQ